MDEFDYQEEIRPAKRAATIFWNFLTILVLLATVCVAGLFLTIYFNPASGFNPYPPPTMPVLISLPTLTPTPRNLLPPTWTPTALPTPTTAPTEALTAVPAETQIQETTPEPESPVNPPGSEGMPFVLQPGDPKAIPNIGHADLGCNWMGVAGQAIGLNGAPVVGLFVQLGGILGGTPLDILSMTSVAPQYGPGGYEFKLGDSPVASEQTLWVQLFDQGMMPLSNKVFFETSADCDQNLVLINFNQVR